MKKAKLKEKICKEDNIILLHSNCDNCGSPLKLNMTTRECKCEYCRTEYCIKEENGVYSKLGQLIHITIGGVEKKFYISEISCEPIYYDAFRLEDGYRSSILRRNIMSLKLEEI